MKNRVYASFLLMLLAASAAMASCGDSAKTPAVDTAPASDTAAVVTEDPDLVKDTVPELDFGGAPFRTIQQNPGRYGFYVGEETGDLVADALYKRIQNVEERLNIDVLETECILWNEVSDKLKQSVMAGGDDYDLVLNQIFRSGSDATQGYLYDWNQIPHISLSQPWYTKSIQDASVGERLYMIESDLSTSYLNQTWFILFNKTIANNMDLEDLYTVVDEGKWTADYLYKTASDLYQDVNGNSKADEGDVFGFATSKVDDCMIAAVYYAMEGRMVELSEDAMSVVHVIQDEKNVARLGKVSEMLFEMPNIYNGLTVGSTERLPRFTSGEFVFVTSQIQVLMSDELRNCEDEYGVLPLPKFDEAQTEYYTLVDGGADILTVPATAQNLEMIGAAVEIMSAFSYNHVVPTYIDIGLEQKGTRDEESVKMLRQILDSRVIDFGYLYDTSSGWCMKLDEIMAKKDSIASKIEKNYKRVDKYYANLLETFYSDVE